MDDTEISGATICPFCKCKLKDHSRPRLYYCLLELGSGKQSHEAELARLRATQEKAIYWLLRAYHSGHRAGWEEGPNVTETMNELHTFLCNQGYDPNLSAEAKKMLQRPVQQMF